MGILSEIDMMNRDAEDDAFEVSSDSEAETARGGSRRSPQKG